MKGHSLHAQLPSGGAGIRVASGADFAIWCITPGSVATMKVPCGFAFTWLSKASVEPTTSARASTGASHSGCAITTASGCSFWRPADQLARHVPRLVAQLVDERLLGGALLVQAHELRHVLDLVDDEGHPPPGVEHGHVERAPVAHLERRALDLGAYVVLLERHRVADARLQDAVQGG